MARAIVPRWLPKAAFVSLLGLGLCSSVAAAAGVLDTKHNLSQSGPGEIKAVTESQVCVFCHIPHNAHPAVPLWNHQLGAVTYNMYASSTIQGAFDGSAQPNGSSKLCLSCHDGAVGIGAVVSAYLTASPIAMTGTDPDGTLPGASPANLGTDLRNDHPVSLRPATGSAADSELLLTPLDGRVKYDAAGFVQCSSCHDPHDDSYGKFLVRPNVEAGLGSRLCLDCHQKFDWEPSAHGASTKLVGGSTACSQGCALCHSTHGAVVATRLLKAGEEGLCNSCHNGSASVSPALKNVALEFTKSRRHPLQVSGRHDALESQDASQVQSTFAAKLNDPNQRHAECEDCHNPHAARSGTHAQGSSTAGLVLLGAWGMKPTYSSTPMSEPVGWTPVRFTDPASLDMVEAYLCFKCHPDQAKYFNPANRSYHACVGAARTSGYGTYLDPWNATSRMTCSDCHTSDNLSVKGPHGSAYADNLYQVSPELSSPVLLFADYQRGNGATSGTGVSGTETHLCFKCHGRQAYGGGGWTEGSSAFKRSGSANNLHNKSHGGKPCTACHSVHGSSRRALLTIQTDAWQVGSLVTSINVASPCEWPGKMASCGTSDGDCH